MICMHGVKQSQTPGEEPGFGNKQAFGTQVSTDDPEIIWYLISICPPSLILSWLLGSDTPYLSWSHCSPLYNLKETQTSDVYLKI